MNRRTYLGGLFVLAAGISGCFSMHHSSTAENSSSSFPKGPNDLTKEELEKRLAEANHWNDVSLVDGKDGTFTGTAIQGDGTRLKLIKVEQTETDVKTEWNYADE